MQETRPTSGTKQEIANVDSIIYTKGPVAELVPGERGHTTAGTSVSFTAVRSRLHIACNLCSQQQHSFGRCTSRSPHTRGRLLISQLCLQQQEEHRVTSTFLCFTFSKVLGEILDIFLNSTTGSWQAAGDAPFIRCLRLAGVGVLVPGRRRREGVGMERVLRVARGQVEPGAIEDFDCRTEDALRL